MTARRGSTELAGVLPVDKPTGMTSHDVVAAVRRATGEGRVGHAGTLDPLATGLLFVMVGRATRLEPYLAGHDKTYEARILFGKATDTMDAEGMVVEERPVPTRLLDAAFASNLLATFEGEREQVPPRYSAVKIAGEPAYRAARRGEEIELAARRINVHSALLLGIDVAAQAWDVRFTVSKGTYIRALGDEIGRAAGTVAHLGALRRTAIGATDVSRAASLDAAVAAGRDGLLRSLFLDPVALLGLPVVSADLAVVADGRPVPLVATTRSDGDITDGALVSVLAGGCLRGIYRRLGAVLRAETVFEPGLQR